MQSIAWWLNVPQILASVRKSKHQNTWERGGNGKVKTNYDTGLRKMMRAARRGKLTGWQLQSIKLAQQSAALA